MERERGGELRGIVMHTYSYILIAIQTQIQTEGLERKRETIAWHCLTLESHSPVKGRGMGYSRQSQFQICALPKSANSVTLEQHILKKGEVETTQHLPIMPGIPILGEYLQLLFLFIETKAAKLLQSCFKLFSIL